MEHNTDTTNQLNSYNAAQDELRLLMGRIEELLDIHEDFAEADTRDFMKYGNVKNLKHVLKQMESAHDFLQAAVNVQSGGC